MDKEKAAEVGSHLGAFCSGLQAALPRSGSKDRASKRGDAGAGDLIKIEDFRAQPPEEKLKPLRSREKEPLLEVVLHAQPIRQDAYILDGFEAYLDTLGIQLDLDKRRFFAEGLCFLPLRVPREVAAEVVKYSFLRLAREMPRLRQFRPVARATPASRRSPASCLPMVRLTAICALPCSTAA